MSYTYSQRGDLLTSYNGTAITYIQARGLEQFYMLYHHTINSLNPTNNQINGISLKNPKLNIYTKAVFDYFENQVSNEFLNWLGV